jgi:hypothetical protein
MTEDAMRCAGRDEVVLLLHGELPEGERDRLLAHLDECAVCRERLAEAASVHAAYAGIPSPRLGPEQKRRLVAQATATGGEAAGRRRSRKLPGPRWRALAAAAVIALAYLAGRFTSPATVPDGATEARLAGLEAELAGLREERLRAAVESPSAIVRMREIHAVHAVDGQSVTEVLLGVLERDPNPNVRLAALDALRARDLTGAEAGTVLSRLSAEPSPLLRSALIDFVVTRQVEGRRPVLQRLERSDDDPAVRDKARSVLESRT